METLGQLSQNVARAEIEDAVNRIQTQRVDMIFGQPVQRIVNYEAPHAIAARAIVVDGAAPRRSIMISEVGTELGEIIPFWSKVVVDHIQHDGESFAMT